MTKRELELGRLLYPEADSAHDSRPKTREECANGCRPCPFVSCAYHLYLDVSPKTGAIKLNFPDIEVEDMKHSCALDVADAGGVTLEMTGEVMNLTRERVRQLEVSAIGKIKDAGPGLREHIEGGPGCDGKRRLPLLKLVTSTNEGEDYYGEGFEEEEG